MTDADSTLPAQPAAPVAPAAARRASDGRALALALLVGLLVMLARSASVVEATNETFDADYHVLHGLLDWTNFRQSHPQPFAYNDPPLGGMLVALPVWLAGGTVLGEPTAKHPTAYQWPRRPSALWHHKSAPNTLRHLISAWKCVLMLPGLAAAFLWARRLYGPPAGWLAWGMFLFEPTISAMTPLATLDAPGLSLTLAAAYLIWRYAEQPTWRRMLPAAVASAAALSTKHTAIMLPFYGVAACGLTWLPRRESVRGEGGRAWLRAAGIWTGRFAAAGALTLGLIWPMTKFDLSAPAQVRSPRHLSLSDPYQPWWTARPAGAVGAFVMTPMPAGAYFGSILEGRDHDLSGHPSYLWGKTSRLGWWYYFPVLATYKVPLGYAAVMLLGAASLAWRRPTWREAALWAAAACWVVLLLKTHINIGWRHALVPYALLLIAATRCVAIPWQRPRLAWIGRIAAVAAFVAAGASAVEASLWHPNYIPYFNRPLDKPYLLVSDSNVDWGQASRQAGRWIKDHRDALAKPIYYSAFGANEAVSRYVKGVTLLGPKDPLPAKGTLVISPVYVAGPYEKTDRFAPLRSAEPAARIAETMLVYDLAKVPR